MNVQYKLFSGLMSGTPTMVQKITDSETLNIPFDPANTCYQAYLKWLEEGNIPLPPDEPVQQNEQTSS
jgi:hypothetical protein